MTALKVEFVDELPGKSPTPSAAIAEFADVLREQPGRWAKYPWSDELADKTRKSRANDINGGHPTAPVALRTGFEGAVREGVMYVRYVGDQP